MPPQGQKIFLLSSSFGRDRRAIPIVACRLCGEAAVQSHAWNGLSWSVGVMNLSSANGYFRLSLPDNRPSAPPPMQPVRSRNMKQTGGIRRLFGHPERGLLPQKLISKRLYNFEAHPVRTDLCSPFAGLKTNLRHRRRDFISWCHARSSWIGGDPSPSGIMTSSFSVTTIESGSWHPICQASRT